MKKAFYFIAIGLASVVSSCGGGNKSESVKLTPEKLSVDGDLEDYLEIVDGEYTLSQEFGLKFSTKVEILNYMTEEELEGMKIQIHANILDESGMPIPSIGEMILSSNTDEIRKALEKGSGEVILSFSVLASSLEGANKFTLSTSLVESKKGSSSNYSNDEDESEVNSSDIDRMLDDYEKYTDQAVKLFKKMNGGDPNAIEEYAEYTEKTQKLMESIDKINKSDNMSPSQASRFVKIQTKMLKVIG